MGGRLRACIRAGLAPQASEARAQVPGSGAGADERAHQANQAAHGNRRNQHCSRWVQHRGYVLMLARVRDAALNALLFTSLYSSCNRFYSCLLSVTSLSSKSSVSIFPLSGLADAENAELQETRLHSYYAIDYGRFFDMMQFRLHQMNTLIRVRPRLMKYDHIVFVL